LAQAHCGSSKHERPLRNRCRLPDQPRVQSVVQPDLQPMGLGIEAYGGLGLSDHSGKVSSRRLGISSPCPATTSDAKSIAPDATTACTVRVWREQWKQLALQAWSGESDAARDMHNLRAFTQPQVEELRVAHVTALSERKTSEQQLWNSLTLVRKRVQALGQNIQFAPKTDDVWRMVQAVERDIQIFAEQERQQSEELLVSECSLESGLHASLARFEGWCELPSASVRSREVSSRLGRSSSCSRLTDMSAPRRGGDCPVRDEPEGVATIRDQVEKIVSILEKEGGPTGGWDHEDHEEFLRVFRKLRQGRPVPADFLAEVQAALPHIAHERLVAHTNWLDTYNANQKEKRSLLERWRDLREQRGGEVVSTNMPSEDEDKELTAAEARQDRGQCARRKELEQRWRTELKQKVVDWKAERLEQHSCQEEQRRQRAEVDRKRKEKERSKGGVEKRLALEAFREQKAAEAVAIHRGCVAASRRALSCQDRRRIAARSASACQRQASMRQASTPSAHSRFDPPARPSALYAHVESRLHRETSATFSRERSILEDSEARSAVETHSKYGVVPGSFAHQGVVRTTRALPAWRGQFGA